MKIIILIFFFVSHSESAILKLGKVEDSTFFCYKNFKQAEECLSTLTPGQRVSVELDNYKFESESHILPQLQIEAIRLIEEAQNESEKIQILKLTVNKKWSSSVYDFINSFSSAHQKIKVLILLNNNLYPELLNSIIKGSLEASTNSRIRFAYLERKIQSQYSHKKNRN